jgi:hypothetical protein
MHPQRVANVWPDLEQDGLSDRGLRKKDNREKSKGSSQ